MKAYFSVFKKFRKKLFHTKFTNNFLLTTANYILKYTYFRFFRTKIIILEKK